MRPPPARLIISVICQEWAITPDQLRARSRTKADVEPRRYAAYLLTIDGGLTHTRAAQYLARDHSTVMHHRRALARAYHDRAVQTQLHALRQLIRDAQAHKGATT